MNAHNFNEDVKVQRFCLTLLGQARLWFQSIEPLENTTWPQLQNLFRQRYSKLGNTHEQLFHAWRSFNFDENTETIDSYVMWIRQVATLNTFRLWRAKNIRSIKEHFTNKIILDLISNRRLKTSSRNSKKKIDQRKVR